MTYASDKADEDMTRATYLPKIIKLHNIIIYDGRLYDTKVLCVVFWFRIAV